MKIDLTIEQADNGMIVRFDEDVKVIENTHSAEEGRKDNLVSQRRRLRLLRLQWRKLRVRIR